MCVVCVVSLVAPMVIFFKWVCWDMWGFGLVLIDALMVFFNVILVLV